MRYTILGFDQKQLIDYNLNMNEVLLLDYIYNAVASPTMQHFLQDGISYVWINHNKILEDLPILDISNDRLKRLLKHLVDENLINAIHKTVGRGSGSKSYYNITEKCEQLKYRGVENNTCKEDRGVENNTCKDYTGVKNNTSNNKLVNNKQLKNNTDNKLSVQDFELKPKIKVPKQNLYSKCIAMINDFTDDKELQEVLVTFLGMRLEVKEKPIYANQWKGLLNKLKKEDEADWIDIVQQSIDKGWLGFYPLKVSKHKSRDGLNSMTDSHERKADMKRRIADGTLERI